MILLSNEGFLFLPGRANSNLEPSAARFEDGAISAEDYSSSLILSAMRSASAEIVNEGLTPNAVGMIDPSAM